MKNNNQCRVGDSILIFNRGNILVSKITSMQNDITWYTNLKRKRGFVLSGNEVMDTPEARAEYTSKGFDIVEFTENLPI